MENANEQKKRTGDEFYAVVSALTRFIETADNDIAPPNKKILKDERKLQNGSES